MSVRPTGRAPWRQSSRRLAAATERRSQAARMWYSAISASSRVGGLNGAFERWINT